MSQGPEEQSGPAESIEIRNFLVTMAETNIPFKPCIIVHGGAGNVPMSKRKPALCAVKEAARIGYHVLLEVR